MGEQKTVKCLIWDLDNTLWDGTLLEDEAVTLRPRAAEVLSELDRRGILLSVASKNEPADALAKLQELGLDEYFLAPQIGWGSKADAVAEIAKRLNLGLDTFAFIDDQPAEREEVVFVSPEVRVYDAAQYAEILDLPEFMPRFVTEDSRLRRRMYREDIERLDAETGFAGSREDFLRTLGMRLTLAPVAEGDLERVEELTLRTSQLNSTGAVFSYEELCGFIESPNHLLLVAEMADKFGHYGKIGLVLAEKGEKSLRIKLLLMSCRVMTRGVGSALLCWLTGYAAAHGLALEADFVPTARNRIMYITYKLMGFEDVDGTLHYRGELRDIPDYLRLDSMI